MFILQTKMVLAVSSLQITHTMFKFHKILYFGPESDFLALGEFLAQSVNGIKFYLRFILGELSLKN